MASLPLRGIPNLSHPPWPQIPPGQPQSSPESHAPPLRQKGERSQGKNSLPRLVTAGCGLSSPYFKLKCLLLFHRQTPPPPPPIRSVPGPNQLLQRAVIKSADRDACFQLFSHLPAKSRITVERGALVCARTGKHPTKISRSVASGEGGGGQSHVVFLLRTTQQHHAAAC